ncbi:hypothetical protein [Bradyrhizobium sp. SZCCHNRI1003]|uniref:hypothetical protein n=1 Tax=Bradyrhizobium sp. SZCCHNRI1003 TaxID=3057275 RepID=UPI002915EFDA|nr:hypothetical protein [Bradyrhizobium sp. SZCCHNRI1003]
MRRAGTDLLPFDENDPFNRVADDLRRGVAELASRTLKTADYRGLGQTDQLQSMAAGLVTGMLGVLFAHIEDRGRDAMVEWLIDYLPQARAQAEGLFEGAECCRH